MVPLTESICFWWIFAKDATFLFIQGLLAPTPFVSVFFELLANIKTPEHHKSEVQTKAKINAIDKNAESIKWMFHYSQFCDIGMAHYNALMNYAAVTNMHFAETDKGSRDKQKGKQNAIQRIQMWRASNRCSITVNPVKLEWRPIMCSWTMLRL